MEFLSFCLKDKSCVYQCNTKAPFTWELLCICLFTHEAHSRRVSTCSHMLEVVQMIWERRGVGKNIHQLIDHTWKPLELPGYFAGSFRISSSVQPSIFFTFRDLYSFALCHSSTYPLLQSFSCCIHAVHLELEPGSQQDLNPGQNAYICIHTYSFFR